MRPLFLAAAFLLLLAGCEKHDPEFFDGPGKRPVYVGLDELRDVRSEAPRPIGLSGPIFLRDTLLFLLEQGRGIHVFNIRDSTNTVDLVFLKIPAVTDFTLNDHLLYADSWRDLVVIDITDLQEIKEVSRLTDVLNPVLYPPLYDGIFECIDESRGAVIGWEDAELEDARCRTVN